MDNVVIFPKHKLHGAHNCQDPDCNVCSGGLGVCERCGGAEASIPTDCPGEPMSQDQQDLVQSGQLDYNWQTGWILLPEGVIDTDVDVS